MSRSHDLYLQAAAKATPPFHRLYFDTQALHEGHWPFVSKQLRLCLKMAGDLSIDVFFPAPALFERAEHWLRDAQERVTTARTKVIDAQKHLQELGSKVVFTTPSEKELRDYYAAQEDGALKEFGAQLTPYPQRPLDEVFRMAVARDFTFEQTKAGVVGLQDCVIAFSILDHVRNAHTSAGLVSNDAVFSKVPPLAPAGVDVLHIHELSQLGQLLTECLQRSMTAELTAWYSEQRMRIAHILENHRQTVGEFLEQTINADEIRDFFGDTFEGNVVRISAAAIESFLVIQPDFDSFGEDSVRFLCEGKVRYAARIERVVRMYNHGGSVEIQPIDETRVVTVDLAGVVNADESLKLESASIRKPAFDQAFGR